MQARPRTSLLNLDEFYAPIMPAHARKLKIHKSFIDEPPATDFAHAIALISQRPRDMVPAHPTMTMSRTALTSPVLGEREDGGGTSLHRICGKSSHISHFDIGRLPAP